MGRPFAICNTVLMSYKHAAFEGVRILELIIYRMIEVERMFRRSVQLYYPIIRLSNEYRNVSLEHHSANFDTIYAIESCLLLHQLRLLDHHHR